MSQPARLLVALLLGLTQLGCSDSGENTGAPAEQAQAQAAQGKLSAAVIELKNALQKNPQDAQARFALAELYLKQELGRAAEKELLQARQLGLDEERVGPALGEALLLSHDYKRVLELVSPAAMKTLGKRADLLRMHADAQLGLGQVELACTQYKEALNLDANLASAYWGLARCARIREGAAAARALYAKALALNPNNARTRVEFGHMEYGLGNLAEAEKQYAEAIKLDGDSLPALAGHALVVYLQGRVEPARAEIARLGKDYPDSPLTHSLRAMLEFGQRNYEAALNAAAQALKEMPQHLPSLALYGRSAYQLGRFEEAWRGLSFYLRANPEDAHIRKLVANSQIRMQRNLDALETLSPLLREGSRDDNALLLAGGANLQLNRPQLARRYFEQALAVNPKSTDARIALARILLAGGDHAGAKSHLRQAVELAPDHLHAHYTLAQAHLAAREYDAALAVLADVDKRWPNRVETPVLQAQALFDKKDVAGARRILEARLRAAPKDAGAALNLARIDLFEGKPAAARAHVKNVLDDNPKHMEAQLMLAGIAGQEGDAKERQRILEQMTKAHPGELAPAMELSRHLLAQGQAYKALEWARHAEKLKADSPEALALLAEVQLAAGEKENALATTHRLATVVLPNSPSAQLRYAQLQLAVNSNREGARFALGRALKLQPDYLEAQTALIALDLSDRKYNAAQETARRIQAQRPAEAVGHVYEGDAMLAQNRYTAAIDAYRKGIDKNGGGTAVVNLHRALVLAGRKAEAEQALEAWLARRPGDIPVRIYRAESAMAEAQYPLARERFEEIQRLRPELPNVLNNLAILYARMGDARALDFARRAHKLAPGNPLIADTLGWMLVERGQHGEGLPLLRQAHAALPEHPQVAYHLAVALERSGAKNDARGLLRNLLGKAQAFPERAEAEALWKKLGG